MQVSAPTERAIDYIAQRAKDVMNAYTPGAAPAFDDVKRREMAEPSLDPLSVALPGGAYALVSDGGGARTLYTRDGGFHIDAGALVDANGRPVLGFTHSGNGVPARLELDSVDCALGRVRNVRVDGDGSLVYDRDTIDPRSGTRQVERVNVGRIALARFPAGTRLDAVDASHGQAPYGVVPHTGTPGDGTFEELRPMERAGSSVDIDRSLEKLQDAYIAFDAMEAARKARGTMGKATMDLLK